MSTDAMPLAEALEVVERYGKILEETQLFGRIGRAQVTLCAAVRRMEAANKDLRRQLVLAQCPKHPDVPEGLSSRMVAAYEAGFRYGWRDDRRELYHHPGFANAFDMGWSAGARAVREAMDAALAAEGGDDGTAE